jgi:hypothetical protein
MWSTVGRIRDFVAFKTKTTLHPHTPHNLTSRAVRLLSSAQFRDHADGRGCRGGGARALYKRAWGQLLGLSQKVKKVSVNDFPKG